MYEEQKVEEISEKIEPEELIGKEKVFYPREIKEPFIAKKRGFFSWLIGRKPKTIINPQIKQPIVWMITRDFGVKWIEGVKSGLFLITDKTTGKQKGVNLWVYYCFWFSSY